jgi:ABC-2 type transport system ATP-binding protein
VLDEPANGLDPLGARALRELIRTVAADGLTVLLCSHDLAEVDAICDDVTVMVRGRVVWDGAIPALRARPGRTLLRTSDDEQALTTSYDGVQAEPHPDGGLVVVADPVALDGYVLHLASRGIAVRSMARESLPLEQALLELTS